MTNRACLCRSPLTIQAGLDAGPQITVQAPAGSKSASGSGGNYSTTLSASGDFFSAGTITVSAPGGADVPAFSASITLPALPVMTSPAPDSVNPLSVTRSNGLTVSWSGGLANEYIELDGYNNTDNSGAIGASFQCTVPATVGTFVVPPSVLLALPAGSFGGLIFHPAVMPVNLPNSGLSASRLTLRYSYFAPLTFK